ncbi:MAG: heme o synthase [Microthrixaceae bacterium]
MASAITHSAVTPGLGSPRPVSSGTDDHRGLVRKVLAYVALTKPRIIELLLISTVPTMFVAERGVPSLSLMVWTVLGGTLSAGGANAVNMYVDRDIDAVMQRTRDRPLVTGAVTPRAALTFAVGIEAVSFALLWATVNLLSAVIAVAACCFYVFVYTLWLKRTSEQNIVIGGAAGAAPVLIGWAAVTGGLGWAPWILFALMFFWTPPHFWALAIKYKDDYSAVDVPMLPSVADHAVVTRRILVYTAAVVAMSLVFGPVARLGWLYIVAAVVLGIGFIALAFGVSRTESPKLAMRLFTYSITYVTLLFGAMAVDALLLGH